MERSTNRTARTALAIAILMTAVAAAENTAQVPFPDGYRAWQHVKSTAAEHGKIYRFYANPQAVEGYRAGRFPNGSVLVRETLPAGGESERMALDVMIKDGQRFEATSGWGFETFDANNGRLAEKERAQCYACHANRKEHDLVFTSLPAAASAGTPYPEGYRHWTFLHSSMVPANFDAFGNKPCTAPCTSGIFHFYANDKAMEGLRTGTYPDGAVLAEEMLEWRGTSSGLGGEGQRRIVGVMVKNSESYASTGGWGYGTFDDGSKTDKLDAKARETCHQCHVARKAQGFVFAEYRER